MTAEISEFEQFANDLATYAVSWIPECQNKIIKHAHELFEDATMRKMLSTYAKLKETADRLDKYEFVKACIGEDITEVEDNEYSSAHMRHYKAVLDDLIFNTYCIDVD